MKKLFLAVALLMGGGNVYLEASEEIPLEIIDETSVGSGNTKAPARPWYITQDDNVLTLPALADDYTLVLLDEDGDVAYTTFVPAGTTTVVLPSTLSGDFELRLVADTYYYRGYIIL